MVVQCCVNQLTREPRGIFGTLSELGVRFAIDSKIYWQSSNTVPQKSTAVKKKPFQWKGLVSQAHSA
jgi:hypothetical protein